MLGNSWKLYAGKFLETMCWKFRVDAGCFLKGVIMAQCYGTILQFQGSGTRGSVEHPSRQTFLERSTVVVMYYTLRHLCPGGVVHYYSHPSVPFDGTI